MPCSRGTLRAQYLRKTRELRWRLHALREETRLRSSVNSFGNNSRNYAISSIEGMIRL